MKLKNILVGLAVATGAALSLATAADAATTPVNVAYAGDCANYSWLSYDANGVVASGRVPCSLHHSTTSIRVSVIQDGQELAYGFRTYRNSLGTGSLTVYSLDGWSVRPSGCHTFWALTDVTVSGVGHWTRRSNAVTLCYP